MRAVVYHGPGEQAWEEVPEPEIVDEGDAIVGVDTVTICGTDLHILEGHVPTVTDGGVLGHEAVGTVQKVGAGVRTMRSPACAARDCDRVVRPTGGIATIALPRARDRKRQLMTLTTPSLTIAPPDVSTVGRPVYANTASVTFTPYDFGSPSRC